MSELQQSCNSAATTLYATELQALGHSGYTLLYVLESSPRFPLLHLRQPVLVLRGTPTTNVSLLNLETHHAAVRL